MITVIAKIIRKNTGYSFIYSIKVAKQFLRREYVIETKDNVAFKFIWEWYGIEEKNWSKELYVMDSQKKELSKIDTWKIPVELFYNYQKAYKKKNKGVFLDETINNC